MQLLAKAIAQVRQQYDETAINDQRPARSTSDHRI